MFHMGWFDKFFLFFGKNSSNHNVPLSLWMVMLWFDEFFFSSSLQISWFPYSGNTIVKQKLDPNHCWCRSTAQTSKSRQTNKQTNQTIKQNNKPYSWPFCFVYRTEASFDDRRWFYAGSKCVLIIKISAIRDTCECCSSLHNMAEGGSENLKGQVLCKVYNRSAIWG